MSSTDTRLCIVLVFLMLASCAPIPPFTRESVPSLLAPLFATDSLRRFEGSGSVRVSANNERGSMEIETRWQGGPGYSIRFYSPFGGLLASLKSGPSGEWEIQAGDSLWKKRSGERMSLGNEFIEYPFTYDEFARILTGRLPGLTVFRRGPDSLRVQEKSAVLYWSDDSWNGKTVDVSVVINRKQSAVKDVIYQNAGPSKWELVFSSFNKSVPEEIRFRDANNNYFYLAYEKIAYDCGPDGPPGQR